MLNMWLPLWYFSALSTRRPSPQDSACLVPLVEQELDPFGADDVSGKPNKGTRGGINPGAAAQLFSAKST